MIKSTKKRALLFILEILVVVLFIGALFVYAQVDKRLDRIVQQTEETTYVEEEVVVNMEAPVMTGYKTYVIFGVDTRKKNAELNGENTDTIIIVSINNEKKDVKLVSIYRDSLLNLGNGSYGKANSAYLLGGPTQAISMLNTNLDLQISGYVTVDFSVLTEIVDYFGGLDIPLSYAEIEHMNNYCVETSKETGKSYTPVDLPEIRPDDIEETLGTYHLNGVQVTSYCRIRYTASMDMGRTERQRTVIGMLVNEAINSGITGIMDLMDIVIPLVETSLTKQEIISMIPTMIGFSIEGSTGFPDDYKFADINDQSYVVPNTLEENVIELHKFLYGKKVEYTPSAEVTNYSAVILEKAESGNVSLSSAETYYE